MTTGLLITNAGAAAIAADLGGGADLVLTHVAFGDAGGVPYNPVATQTALVAERYRSTIAAVSVLANEIIVDAIIPADTPDASARPSHSFNVAECGLFNAAGTLIAVARMSNGYKPPPSSGQAAIATFRLKLAVSNPAAISVVIDPQAQIPLGRNVRPGFIAVDAVLNAPPGSPAAGATFLIGTAPTGAWSGFAHRIAQWIGVWSLSTAPVGTIVCDNSAAEDAAGRLLRRTAAGWASAAASATAFGFVRLTDVVNVLGGANSINVAASGGSANPVNPLAGDPFNSLASAFAWLQGFRITGSMTVNLGAGQHALTSATTLQHPDSARITVQGAAMINGGWPTGYTVTGFFRRAARNRRVDVPHAHAQPDAD